MKSFCFQIKRAIYGANFVCWRDTRVLVLLNDLTFFHVRALALLLVFEKFTRAYLFQIAIGTM